jgi:hypothetical protein
MAVVVVVFIVGIVVGGGAIIISITGDRKIYIRNNCIMPYKIINYKRLWFGKMENIK